MYDYLPLCFDLWNKCGLERVIISPGSRSAPLVQASCENTNLNIQVVPDERAAAFIALGMSQATKKIVGLICTSGSAAYNYAPAIAEAFFTNTSLLILTADRPPEWINQNDGQTIFQHELYGKHVIASYEMPCGVDKYDEYILASKIAKEAIHACNKGPVHINLPFREPLYEPFFPLLAQEKQLFTLYKPYKAQKLSVNNNFSFTASQKKVLSNAKKILIIVGQTDYDPSLRTILESLVVCAPIVLLQDILANTHGIQPSIQEIDVVTMRLRKSEKLHPSLLPDLLITLGKSILSKPLKQWLKGR